MTHAYILSMSLISLQITFQCEIVMSATDVSNFANIDFYLLCKISQMAFNFSAVMDHALVFYFVSLSVYIQLSQ